MSRKLPSPKQCPRCGESSVWFTGTICHNCYRKYKWVPKKDICPRCKRLKPCHAKGYCNGCYNTLFHLQRIKDSRNTKRHKISAEKYKQITSSCLVCGFDKVVELHHVDCNRHNSDEENMIGLCPNHHKMIHIIQYKELLRDAVERLMTAKRLQTTLTFTQIPNSQTDEIYALLIRKENSPVLMAAN